MKRIQRNARPLGRGNRREPGTGTPRPRPRSVPGGADLDTDCRVVEQQQTTESEETDEGLADQSDTDEQPSHHQSKTDGCDTSDQTKTDQAETESATPALDAVTTETPAVVDQLDRGPGSSVHSTEQDWARSNSGPEANDGRSLTRTTFYTNDTERNGPGQNHRDREDQVSWAKLAKWNDGVQSDKSRGSQNWSADIKRWIDAITDRLEATTHQRNRTQYVVNRLDLGRYCYGRHMTEHVILAVTTLIIDQEIGDWANRALGRDVTKQLAVDLELTDSKEDAPSSLMDIRRQLREWNSELVFSPGTDDPV